MILFLDVCWTLNYSDTVCSCGPSCGLAVKSKQKLSHSTMSHCPESVRQQQVYQILDTIQIDTRGNFQLLLFVFCVLFVQQGVADMVLTSLPS